MAGRTLKHNRRAVLEGLSRILDASAPEELFTGPGDEAEFLHRLLVEAARARQSRYYGEICRTARRHGVTPEYLVDRAVVLLSTIDERCRTDLYGVLGVAPLASGEAVRRRWLELAKRHHPDTGGDGALFRRAQQAYEVLRDPVRRADYERFWSRALGPFVRVLPRGDVAVPAAVRADDAPHEDGGSLGQAVAGLSAALRALDGRLGASGGGDARGVSGLLVRIEALLAPIRAEEVDRLRAEVGRMMGDLESLREQLSALAALKRTIGEGPGSLGGH
jgi:hypothetical protein